VLADPTLGGGAATMVERPREPFMRRLTSGAFVAASLVAGVGMSLSATPSSQLPFAPESAAGTTVTPAFEGWYENPDGTFNLSFGYYNRNTEEVLEIPLGPNNFIEPAQFDGGQPTHFQPRQNWGVFVVKVPADHGDTKVYWTLKIRGETFSVPGHLKTDWQIDALAGEAGSGNTPPVLRFGRAEGAGPAGVMGPPLTVSVRTPLTVTVWARDDGKPSSRAGRPGAEDIPITLTWFKHQGPGDVTFEPPSAELPVSGAKMATAATFSLPGEYLLRVRANDASGYGSAIFASAGHAQCCWSNGFVKVMVNP